MIGGSAAGMMMFQNSLCGLGGFQEISGYPVLQEYPFGKKDEDI